MLVENQMIKMIWNSANKKYYENKGYSFTRYKDYFYVKAEDLSYYTDVKLKIQCDNCGKKYEMTCAGYFKGFNKSKEKGTILKHFCNDCKAEVTREKWYDDAREICDNKGYVLLSKKEDLANNTTYIKYVCPIHGEHLMRLNNFLNGKGCPDCIPESNRERFKLSPDEVEKRVKECGGNLLNKEDYINQTEKNLLIECFECGKPFLTSLRNYTQHDGQVCDDCSGIESVGEKRIRHYLEGNKINFIPQKWFADCRDSNPLPFDFYLPDYNVIIEFDGRQHFTETNYFSYSLEITQKHDKIKNNYCKAKGIYLIRIPHWNINKIEQILDKELILHEDIV